MNPNDRPEFEQIIDELADIFPVSANRVDSAKRNYFKHLADLSIERLRRVAVQAIQQLDTFPSIHRLRDLAGRTNAEVCQACAGSGRISHVKAITIDFFEECMQSVEHTIEAVYGHCRKKYDEDPDIRLWAKQALTEHMGWSSLPARFQTDEHRAQIRQGLQQLTDLRAAPEDALNAIRQAQRQLEMKP